MGQKAKEGRFRLAEIRIDDQIEALLDPLATAQFQNQAFVQSTGGTIVDILDSGIVLQFSLTQPGL